MIACPSCGTLNVPGTTECMRCRNPMSAPGQAPAGGGFGGQAPAGGGFGGQPPAGGGFGGQAPAGGGFGGQPPAGGGFGGQPPAGGGFGGQPPAGGSYGQPAPGGYPPAPGVGNQIDVGDVLRATFESWKRNLALLAMVNAICMIPGWIFSASGAIYQAVGMQPGAIPDSGTLGVVMALAAVGWVVSVICNSVAIGATTRIGLADLGGGRFEGVGPAIAFGVSRIGTSLGIMVLTGIGIGVGFVFCIVPAIIVGTMLSVAMPSAIAEGKGVMDSLTRSVDLTNGNRVNVFLVYLVAIVAVFLVIFPVFCCIGAAAGGAGSVAGSVVPVVFIQLFSLAFMVVLVGYFQLLAVTVYQRLSGYGVDTDAAAVAQVFR